MALRVSGRLEATLGTEPEIDHFYTLVHAQGRVLSDLPVDLLKHRRFPVKDTTYAGSSWLLGRLWAPMDVLAPFIRKTYNFGAP